MTTTTPPLRAQVLALRRTQSARAVAQALSIPLGEVDCAVLVHGTASARCKDGLFKQGNGRIS